MKDVKISRENPRFPEPCMKKILGNGHLGKILTDDVICDYRVSAKKGELFS